MSATGEPGDAPTAQERAEAMMERLGREGARLFGRVREEVEDIVAEARDMTRGGEHRPSS